MRTNRSRSLDDTDNNKLHNLELHPLRSHELLTESDNQEEELKKKLRVSRMATVDEPSLNFCTKNKLERGTLSAFRREARERRQRTGSMKNRRRSMAMPVLEAAATLDKESEEDEEDEEEEEREDEDEEDEDEKSWLMQLLPITEINSRYIFQHPLSRLAVVLLVIVCNFLSFAEDPISHSAMEAEIPILGNIFSIVLTKYPSDWRLCVLKASLWMSAIACGLVLGKMLIHGQILNRAFRLKMFRDNQGSWIVQFLTVLLTMYLSTHVYNAMLMLLVSSEQTRLVITPKMGLAYSTVMKVAASGTWLGDLITALIVIDMMLQDSLYPQWAPRLRRFWRSSNSPRVLLFWMASIVSTSMVIMVITSDTITWDRVNRDFFATTELSRAFLSSFILVLDLTIVMQDWDFPHFTKTLDVKLPGLTRHAFGFQMVAVEISGKWFNYGIIVLAMLFDLNMLKNQVTYTPERFGQYVGYDNKVVSVTNVSVLQTNDERQWAYEARIQINPHTLVPFMDEDFSMHSRYVGYPTSIKLMALSPCLFGFLSFFTLIAVYGRMQLPDKARPQHPTVHTV